MNREPKDAAKAKPSAEETLARIRAALEKCSEQLDVGECSKALSHFHHQTWRIMEEHDRG